jgi:hypothetical protein
MNGVVEVDAGEDREHIGLQERDQQFERGERNRQRQANRRTLCETGRRKKERISMNITSGTM